MACPTCGRTMQSIGRDDEYQRTWWCATCGTLLERNGDFSRVELPGWLRQVVAAANLGVGKPDQWSGTTIEATFQVSRRDQEHVRVELEVRDHAGRRVV